MSWKNPEKWKAMVSGVDCPFCKDIHLDVNPFSFKVAEMKQSIVRLPRNQFMHGYVLVALKRHATELYELSEKELAEFWEDVAKVARAIKTVFSPVKINYAIYGNLCPHLHCHLFPQQIENDPHAAIKQDEKEVLLNESEYPVIIEAIREHLVNKPNQPL